MFKARPVFRRFLTTPPSKKAFVFDIDGVLLRGSKAIPEAPQALALLNEAKVPFILLTNGGGLLEQKRTEYLSDKLNTELSPLQLVQSHTPMRAWAQSGKYKRVLVVGGDRDNARHAALDYGFPSVVTPMDIVKFNPAVSPHHRLTADELAQCALPIDPAVPLDAVLVFNDPRDMATDVQIVCDVLNSDGGRIGTLRREKSPTPAVPIVFSNNDYLWANDYGLPRFGQGAFRMTIERLYYETNQCELQRTILGKPFRIQHDYAHWVLIEWDKILHGHTPHGFMPVLDEAPTNLPFSDIYMVGDNPASDIHGANTAGWQSILLRTGVYKGLDWDTTEHRPTVGVFDNVLASVEHVLSSEK